MKNMNCNRKNYNAIDLTKFICAILVVSIHIAPLGNNPDFWLLNYGIQNYLARIAVPFFFITSGFFLYRKISYENFSIDETKKYVLKLFRLYMIWTFIYLPLKIISFIWTDEKSIYLLLRYIRDFIFKGSYTQLWYLNATIFAVILTAFFLKKRITLKGIIMCAAVFYCVGLFAQSYFGLIEPLRDLTPSLWYILQLCEKVIGTTRNGLFEGFLFISIGMFFAFYETRLPKNLGKAIWGFTISMLLMFGEVASLTYFDFIKEKDMYLFLVPAAFFLFYIVLCIKLKDSRVYIYLRILSSLIFYMHLWVLFVIDYVSNKMEIGLENTSLRFIFTIIITIICSVIVIELSNIHKLRWLKKIYS